MSNIHTVALPNQDTVQVIERDGRTGKIYVVSILMHGVTPVATLMLKQSEFEALTKIFYNITHPSLS